jgi:hypothetical protein
VAKTIKPYSSSRQESLTKNLINPKTYHKSLVIDCFTETLLFFAGLIGLTGVS